MPAGMIEIERFSPFGKSEKPEQLGKDLRINNKSSPGRAGRKNRFFGSVLEKPLREHLECFPTELFPQISGTIHLTTKPAQVGIIAVLNARIVGKEVRIRRLVSYFKVQADALYRLIVVAINLESEMKQAMKKLRWKCSSPKFLPFRPFPNAINFLCQQQMRCFSVLLSRFNTSILCRAFTAKVYNILSLLLSLSRHKNRPMGDF